MSFSSETLNVVNNNIDPWNVIKSMSVTNPKNAFYCCDLNDVIEKILYWKKLMPRIQPFYAVKCNDDKYILKLLATFGVNFHCCSSSALNKVLSLNVKPNRIIYANTAKPKMFIQHALKNGVDLMTFDSKTELYKIKEIFPNAKLVIRITSKVKALAELGEKFGCHPRKEAPKLLKISRDLGLNVVGVSFHVGYGCQEISAFSKLIKLAKFVFNSARKMGCEMNLLDIGGGFSGNKNLLKECADVINPAIEKYFPEKDIKVISEPGTYFVESAFTLACNVHSIRTTLDENKVKKYYYYVNDSVYGGFGNVMLSKLVRIPRPITDYGNCELCNSTVWGITNDSVDKINTNILLPKLKFEEWLVYDNMGNYSLPFYTAFSGIETPKVYTIINENNWHLIQDLFWFAEEKELQQKMMCIEQPK
ncbi:hypothetical protein RN001_007851 [Aquatica leii]|uniref:ornithine decarboxylase n=1 Tax=Aquatica leii TaxID=1421715 RepID=A0AAN7SR43_9COLE|nr:hypothetical protein RN001_007851 [Aquatica leii]